VSQPPFSKKDIDRVNTEIEKIQQPRPPQMRPAPGGTMREDAAQVEIQVRRDVLQAKKDRVNEMQKRLQQNSTKLRKDFERSR